MLVGGYSISPNPFALLFYVGIGVASVCMNKYYPKCEVFDFLVQAFVSGISTRDTFFIMALQSHKKKVGNHPTIRVMQIKIS